MEEADLLVVNGANFEEGMLGVIDSVADSGTPVFAFADAMTLLEGGHDHGDDHDHEGETTEGDTHDHDHEGETTEGDTHDHDHEGETHDHEAEGEKAEGGDHDHDHGGFDPHLWTDPARMIDGVNGLAAALAAVEGIDAAALEAQAAAYVAELEALDTEIEAALAAIPAEDRVLVTNHEVFGYFADRYGFEVVGAVVPSLTTSAETSVRELEDLAAIITAEGIPAIFAETTQSTDLAEALAGEVGGEVAIVELFTESLGEPGSGAETYIDLMRTNAELIVAALTGA
jgi:zinc/manganese transport system substrate-binding protein